MLKQSLEVKISKYVIGVSKFVKIHTFITAVVDMFYTLSSAFKSSQ